MSAIEPAAAALAARTRDEAGLALIKAGHARLIAAEAGDDDSLDADIAFHVAILEACGNPFYRQFHDLVETALRTSIRFTNRFVGRTADLDQHRAATGTGELAVADGDGRLLLLTQRGELRGEACVVGPRGGDALRDRRGGRPAGPGGRLVVPAPRPRPGRGAGLWRSM